MKTTTIIQALIAIGAIIDRSLGLLEQIGLSDKQIAIVQLSGLILATLLPSIFKKSIRPPDEAVNRGIRPPDEAVEKNAIRSIRPPDEAVERK